jgi:hypothetical protein
VAARVSAFVSGWEARSESESRDQTSLISTIRPLSMRAFCALAHTLTYRVQCSMSADASLPINAVSARHAGYGDR